MSGRIAARLAELGITLPKAPVAAANYVPYVVVGKLVYVSGQLAFGPEGLQLKGRLGAELTVEQGQEAARICALNLLAQAQVAAGGDLDKVKRCVRLGCFIASVDGFTDQPKVANGASDLMVAVLGEAGKHARAAIGTNVLPLGASVEVEGLFELE